MTRVSDLAAMHVDRLARARSAMAGAAVDAMVLLHPPHVAFVTGVLSPAVDATHAIHRRAVCVLTADTVETAECRPELDEAMPALRDLVGPVDGRTVAVDEITGAMHRTGVLAGAELVDAARVLGPARLRKSDAELECIHEAQLATEEAMVVAREACVPGATRAVVAGAFLGALRAEAGLPNLIDPIFEVMPRTRRAGTRTSTGHVAFPTGLGNPTFAEGDLVWVDAGASSQGYVSDFGATWCVGRPPSAEERALHDGWQAVVDASLSVIRPGATLAEVGRAAVAAAGADPGERPWLPHFYLAHGIGLDSAEAPMVGTDLGEAFDESVVLSPGMVLVLEPVVWRDGVGGYRAEDVVAVTTEGWRRLGLGPDDTGWVR
jgi:Xaa-Pro aminopeptidase